ncbi:hypothetical protein WJ64_32725 [Burkholderia ubonensis]|nr:hypothetical protein WJ64_32725 [Burkholderia ubonensis]
MLEALARWRARGVAVSCDPPTRGGRYLQFSADSGRWLGLVEPREWLSRFAPELAGLASAACTDEQLCNLFEATAQPLVLPVAELAYRKLRVDGFVEGAHLSAHASLCVETPQGSVWLRTLPALPEEDADPDLANVASLPVPLQFEIGRSQISLRLLTRLAVGDVLLINQVEARVGTCGIWIGEYLRNEEGLVINHEDGRAGEPNIPLGQVPVSLEFVLKHHTVTVVEMARLYEGQLIPLADDAETRIEVRANGVLIARGELVQVDGKLGILINELQDGGTHGG